MTPLEKTEQLIEKGQADLNDVREKISELKEKEKAIISRNTELENTRIVQIVQLSNLNVSQLKDMLAKIKYNTFSSTSITSIPLTKIERKYFFMKKH